MTYPPHQFLSPEQQAKMDAQNAPLPKVTKREAIDCLAELRVADQRPQRGDTAQSLADDRVNDAFNEHQHSNAESLDGGWVE